MSADSSFAGYSGADNHDGQVTDVAGENRPRRTSLGVTESPANEDIDEQLTGNPDGVTAPEIPDPPDPSWAVGPFTSDVWRMGWRAGYEAARLDQGRTT